MKKVIETWDESSEVKKKVGGGTYKIKILPNATVTKDKRKEKLYGLRTFNMLKHQS